MTFTATMLGPCNKLSFYVSNKSFAEKTSHNEENHITSEQSHNELIAPNDL